MTTYSDTFNRANGAPGANWTAINGGTWVIASNALTQTQTAGTYRGSRWAGGAFASNNFYARVTARAPSGQGFGVIVRCPTTGTAEADIDGYAIVGFVDDQWYRVEFANGSDAGYVGLGGTCNASTDYTIEARANGSTITVYLNGTQLAQWTDTTYTTGGAMLVTYGGTVTFDNFEAADLVTVVAASLAATATTATAQGALAALRQALAEASQETGAAVGAVSILRWLDHTVVASTATSAGNFRTEVIVGLLRLLVSGALRPTIGAVEFWPAVIATSRQPFIRGE